jgi:hypothetical protein
VGVGDGLQVEVSLEDVLVVVQCGLAGDVMVAVPVL